MRTAMPAVAASPTGERSPDLNKGRVFEPVLVEHDLPLRDVTGVLPADLGGTLYRNGPARWEANGFVAGHLFDGDGMINSFTFDRGEVRYRNRFVRTGKFLAGEAAGREMPRGLATQRRGGVLANAFRGPADRANTHAVFHGGRLLALSDDGRPWELDAETLATVGRHDFDGDLPTIASFSPHPRIDPKTGELFNFGLTAMPQAKLRVPVGLRCYRVDPTGCMSTICTVPLDHLYINHDFGITDRYLVFVLAPIVIPPGQAAAALLGFSTYERAAVYRDDIGTKILLVPRAGGPPRIIECPPLAYVHFNNTFEEHGDVVIDLVRYPAWDPIADALRQFRDGQFAGGFLSRARVTAADKVVVEDVCELPGEFPQHDARLTSKAYRYGYYAATVAEDARPAIVKVDMPTGRRQAFVLDAADFPGEPIFVPRSADSAEDDGWLLCLVYRGAEHLSALFVLDARDLEAGPVAFARLPHHCLPGFHGSFVPRQRHSI